MLPVLSLSFSFTYRANTLVRTILLWSNKCNNNNAEITPFIPVLAGRNLHMSQTPSYQRQEAWPTNCTPKDAHAFVFCFFLFFFSNTSGTPHARHIRARFELWGGAISIVTSCFFLSFGVFMKGIQFTQLCYYISFLSFVRLTICFCFFYAAGDGCWIHVYVSCSACIYGMLLVVSLNDEPRLTHRRQQSVGSAFQFHYRRVVLF